MIANKNFQLERSRIEELVWCNDTGASSQMTLAKNASKASKKGTPFSVRMGDKSTVEVAGYGSVETNLDKNEKSVRFVIENFFYVLSLQYSLLSVALLTEKKMKVLFDAPHVR